MGVSQAVDEASSLVPTKRNVLRVIAGIYDPLGFMQPLLLHLKLLFQEICLSGAGWDDVISTGLQTAWDNILQYMSKMSDLVIQRCFCMTSVIDPVVNVQLHAFQMRQRWRTLVVSI